MSSATCHHFPASKRKFRVLLAGVRKGATYQNVVSQFKIPTGQIHGIQIPRNLEGFAFAYFVSHEWAKKAVHEWPKDNSTQLMFLQTVSTDYKYKVDLPFSLENINKVKEDFGLQIVSMNYVPSSKFWAVSFDEAVLDLPDYASTIDMSVTTLKLKWASSNVVNETHLKDVLETTWGVSAKKITIKDNLAYVTFNRAELVKASVSRILYLDDIIVTNLSFNPRKGKSTMFNRLSNLVEDKFASLSKGLKLHETVNGVVDTYSLEKEYQDKIDSLREEITSLKNEHAKRIEELEKKVMNKVDNFVQEKLKSVHVVSKSSEKIHAEINVLNANNIKATAEKVSTINSSVKTLTENFSGLTKQMELLTKANLALDEKVKKQQMEMVKIQAVINDVKESVTGISESVHEDVRISLNNTDAEVATMKNSMNQVRDCVKVINGEIEELSEDMENVRVIVSNLDTFNEKENNGFFKNSGKRKKKVIANISAPLNLNTTSSSSNYNPVFTGESSRTRNQQ